MRKKGIKISNTLVLLTVRLTLLYVIMGLCRLCFYLYNLDLMPTLTVNSIIPVLKGSFVFDTASIFYVNILFVFLSLIPFYFRETIAWQRFIGIIFAITNGVAILINLCDVFYYPYKLARIAGDDLRYLKEDIFNSLLLQYWWAIALVILFMFVLYFIGFVLIKPRRNVRFIANKPFFYVTQLFISIAAVILCVIAIRGFNVSKASFPITVSDATNYVEPKYSSLILSNPFSLIRTAAHTLQEPKFTSKEKYSPIKQVDTSRYNAQGMNVMIIILESFGSAHIKSISDAFPSNAPSFTPFLDSLFQHGTLMINAYQGGGRSIDALPSVWASIPSYKQNFLALPQSQSTYHALPEILSEMGYSTAFMHGSVSTSMSFKAFGQMAGVKKFVFREDYGTADFDGKWGIWDHKFFPYIVEQTNKLHQPFMNTIFTLSSHHPFSIPEGYEGKYPKGKEPIQEVIAYSDDALRSLFAIAKQQNWYNNTLFIITADHGSGSDNDKWRAAPYNHRVPLFLYTPNGMIESTINNKIVSHLDIMPTILAMMRYRKPFFAFGEDIFSDNGNFVVNYNSGAYNLIKEDGAFILDETKSADLEKYKAFVLSYYKSVKERRYTE